MKNIYTALAMIMMAACLLPSVPASAAEDKAPKSKDDAKEQPQKTMPSPDAKLDSKKLNDMIDALLEHAEDSQKTHFMALYHTHNLIGVVKTVRHDMSNAVEACANKNPDLAKKMTSRFKQWNEGVDPILEEATGQINNMIIVQNYAPPQAITALLNESNKLRAKGEASFNKVPVSTPEACNKLHDTMIKTQKNLIAMLRETLIVIPQLLQKQAPSPAEKPDEPNDES